MCDHIDYPCCGCDDGNVSDETFREMGEAAAETLYNSFPDDDEEGVDYEEGCAPEDDGMTDVEADADTLRCAGWGCDEDYFQFDCGDGE